MVRVSPPSVSASSGELSQLMYGRRDFARFQNGLRACRGFIPLPEGPVTRLPGTRFMGFTHNNLPARLMVFTFKDEDAMLLEWTASLLRFWRQGALVEDGGVPYTLATPYSLAQARRLQSLQSADRIYLTEGSLPPHRLSRAGLTDWSINETPFEGGPFADRNLDQGIQVQVSGITGAVTLSATADLFGAHHVGTLFQLLEIDTSNTPYWTADVDISIGGRMYYDNNCYEVVAFDDDSARTGGSFPETWPDDTPPATYADYHVVWTNIAYSALYAPWSANSSINFNDRRNRGLFSWEVTGFTSGTRKTGINAPVHPDGDWLSEPGGPIWRFLHSGSGIVRITNVASAISASGTVESRLPDGLVTSPTYRWAEQAWSDVAGWPRAIGAFEQRHIYGGTPTDPRRLWFSVIGGTVDFAAGPLDDDGFNYTLAPPPRNVGEIRGIVAAGDMLFVATSADELIGRATDIDRAFARETSKFSIVSDKGAADADVLVIDGLPFFIDKTGNRLIYMQPDNAGKLTPEILTQIARHILGTGAVKIVRQDTPLPIVWAQLADGDLGACTFEPSQQAVGFHRHHLGGHLIDIEVMPSDDGTSQHLWLEIRRTLDGVERHCIERMEAPFVDLDGQDVQLCDAWHQFCALRWQGEASTVIGGLDHLAGEVVTAWTDFGGFAGLPVSAEGDVTLPRAVTSAIVGLDMTEHQRVDTLDIVTGQPDGGDDGRLRTHRATGVRLHRTAGGTFQIVGTTDGLEQPHGAAEPLINLRAFQTPALRDGIVEIGGLKGWDHQIFLRFQPEPGAPLTITARTPTLMIGDD